MIPELKTINYSDWLHILGLWALEEWRNRTDIIQVYMLPYKKFFEIDISSRTQGHSLKLFKNDLPQHFSERIINRWKSLDNDTSLGFRKQFQLRPNKLRLKTIDLFMGW